MLVAMLFFSQERHGPEWQSNGTTRPNVSARIDKLMADMKPTPTKPQTARLQASIEVVSLPQGPALAVGRRPVA